ncbi:uncharacterized protein ATNIH1004_004459 [Aspergillus tanneri]|uniref:Uncharacterized protein n=1 Tax=Aspergillus tanneri TaxID=1220188 RepID=A0A5M9MT72_9EURO|nr:uncharacterized protein ATNIH1004_004459 [Aspergillus tanneri]KAA8648574.1 hypothetical protein ATNIH1004_004459 [Aspergillus tanneri]
MTMTMIRLDIANQYGLSARYQRTIDLTSDGFPHNLIQHSIMLIHIISLRIAGAVGSDALVSDRREGDGGSERKLRGDPALPRRLDKFTDVDAVVQGATSLMRNIGRMEENIPPPLDVRRNQIMVLEKKVEIVIL